jgi:hypothetical protein
MGTGGDPAAVARAEEQRRADRLRRTVDVACAVLRQGRLTRAEGESVVALARDEALGLFPGKGDVFDLVLAPRFRRVLDEFCPPPLARVLTFRRVTRGPATRGPR